MRRHVRWFVFDLLATLVAITLAGLFWRTLSPLHVGWAAAPLLALCFALLFSAVNALLHVNQIEWSRAAATRMRWICCPVCFVSLVAALLMNNLLPAHWLGIPEAGASTPGVSLTPWGTRALLPNGMLIISAGLAFLGFLGMRYRTRLITGVASRWVSLRGVNKQGLEKVLILGGGDTGQLAAWMLTNGKYALSMQVVGVVDDDLYKQDSRIHGLNVLGRREDIPQLVDRYEVGIIVFAIHNISPQERQDVIEICNRTPARVFLFPDIPAALQHISHQENGHKNGRNGNGNGKKAAAVDPLIKDFSSSLIISGIPPAKVDGWLAQLEETVQAGDAPGALQQIQIIRSLVNCGSKEHETVVEGQGK